MFCLSIVGSGLLVMGCIAAADVDLRGLLGMSVGVACHRFCRLDSPRCHGSS
jgi:hypothetical protein